MNEALKTVEQKPGETPGLYIKSISFNDGSSFDLERNSIILVTGSNNCGKSQFLRDIYNNKSEKVVLTSCELGFQGVFDETLKKFAIEYFGDSDKHGIEYMAERWKGDINQFFETMDEDVTPITFQFRSEIMKIVTTANRIESLSPSAEREARGIRNKKAFKAIYESKELEKKIHKIVANTFGTGVIINRDSFRDDSLRFMNLSDLEKREDRGEATFARWLERQPILEEQGDGVRSFCTVVMSILTDLRPLIIIDEPEAFLHPPQIRQLARTIASEAPPNSQVLIATHSNDFVQGLLNFANDRVSVVRLIRYREGEIEKNLVKKLNPNEISTFWRDPLLKTSDAMASLFHDVAVIVEGDSDARFFQAMVDAMYGGVAERIPNMRFVHCGGKDRIPKIASALRSAGVPVVCIVDIDIIDDKHKFHRLFDALGGQGDTIVKEVQTLIEFVASQRSVQNASDAKLQIDEVFEKLDAKKPIPNEAIEEFRYILQSSSAWKHVKKNGCTFFTGGEIYNKFMRIRDESIRLGIIINQHGELENYCRSVTPRKSEWLSEVLQKDLITDTELEPARKATQELISVCEKAIKNFVNNSLLEKSKSGECAG